MHELLIDADGPARIGMRPVPDQEVRRPTEGGCSGGGVATFKRVHDRATNEGDMAEVGRGAGDPSIPGPILRIDVAHGDGAVTVRLDGEFDLSSAGVFDYRVRPLLRRYDASQIVVDCSGLTFIDSTGMWQLVRLAKTAEHGRLTLAGASPFLLQVLALMGAEEVFHVPG